MGTHFADRLVAAIRGTRAPVCIGIDPVLERLPGAVRRGAAGPADAVRRFATGVIDAVADHVGVVKVNSAFFERHGGAGFDVLFEVFTLARRRGLLVIADGKRGDVGHTAEQYALSMCDPPSGAAPDAVTLHSYLGWDAVAPFCADGCGVFVLVQTSNPAAGAVQDLTTAGGCTVAEAVGALVQRWAEAPEHLGASGYSRIGAVVAPRNPEQARRLRGAMPSCLFLVPGYGAEGAGAEDIVCCFKPDGSGALVNASRSVIYAFGESTAGSDWQVAVGAAAQRCAADVAIAVGLR